MNGIGYDKVSKPNLWIPPIWIPIVTGSETVDQNDFSKSVKVVPVNKYHIGRVRGISLVTELRGTGETLENAWSLWFFNRDPEIASGDTNLDTSRRRRPFRLVEFLAGDWDNMAAVSIASLTVDFVYESADDGAFWLAAVNRSATSINSDAADDETLGAWLSVERVG